MDSLEVTDIVDWHAHVYFNASSRDAAWNFRDIVGARFGDMVAIGRFHERPVGPHPQWSFQVAFAQASFAEVFGWLALNHGALDLFVHPNTGDELTDHRDRAVWLGRSYTLDLAALDG
jgi:DOPA 4,5-dioxygenase